VDAPLLKLQAQGIGGLRRTGDNHVQGRVDRSHDERSSLDQVADPGLGGPDRDHGARGQGLHQARPGHHQAHPVGQAEDSGSARSHELAQAVADQGLGLQPPGPAQFPECVFQAEQGRLGVLRLLQKVGVATEEHFAQGVGPDRFEQGRAALQGLAEDGFLEVQGPAHPGVLRALAGEHHGQGGRATLGRWVAEQPRGTGARQPDLQVPGGPLRGRADQGQAVREVVAAHPGGVGHVGQAGLGVATQELAQAGCGLAQGCGGRGREGQQVPGAGGARIRCGCIFFEDHLGDGSRDTESADGGDAGPIVGGPGQDAVGHAQVQFAPGNQGVRVVEVQVRRDGPMLQDQDRLDQAGDAGRPLRVAEIRFQGPDHQGAVVASPRAQHGVQGL